ncbi:MAG: TIGR02453 family protein [Planctomycetota bacterium]|nr:TIGR02453 family protein [Planctomycetota bacterium]
MAFNGFPPETVKFLVALEKHNDRPWFQANKARYEQFVRGPALAFIEAMGPRLEKISLFIDADPSPNGGSLRRIYRDTRFGGDKQPYKTNIGIQFRHERGDDIHAPGFYFHIDPKEFFICCGMWRPDSATLTAVRTRIAERPDAWKLARDDKGFVKTWGQLTGDRLKRPPRGFDPAGPYIEDIQFKDYLGLVDLPREQLGSPKLPDVIAKILAAGSPLMKFLCDALALPY